LNNLYARLLKHQENIVVVGLGYVGLPLAVLLAKHFKVEGYDTDISRVEDLLGDKDRTGEVSSFELSLTNENLDFTSNPQCISESALIIVAVPTPVNLHKKPDLRPLIEASRVVGEHMQKGTIVVYESTVYPGVVENHCKMALENASHMKHTEDFHLGYSPERVNPGDKEHTIDKITKVVSGSSQRVTTLLQHVYGSVINDIYMAPSIRVAEAAKVIENIQRDVNIALMNEFAVIFDRIGLDTREVLDAAETKWNFMPFEPGLVGGHCIGVDPYYLTHLAKSVGYDPKVILSGRDTNDGMAEFIGMKALTLVRKKTGKPYNDIKIAVLGMSFKENIPDIRNSKSLDITNPVSRLKSKCYLVDPVVDHDNFLKEKGFNLIKFDDLPKCDAIIIAVKHDEFRYYDYPSKLTKLGIVLDVKGMLERSFHDFDIWRL